MTREELNAGFLKEATEFTRQKEQAEKAYRTLYEQYFKTGQQITIDQRSEVRKALIEYHDKYSSQKEKQMLERHENERQQYNAEAYLKWVKLEEKRADMIQEYGSVANVPKYAWNNYQDEKRSYFVEWGEKGNHLKSLMREQNLEKHEMDRLFQETMEHRNLSPYERTIRTQMKERVDFNGKAADNWKQHEIFRKSLEKEYSGWNNVPAYQKELFKQRKVNFEKEWGNDGTQKQAMRKRHQEEIATQIRIETEKYRNPQKDKGREREKE